VIFQPDLIVPILRRQKTETRQPRRPDQADCRYKTGHSYAVQPGRGRCGIATISVLNVHTEPLGQLTPASARAEGFADLPEFEAYWLRMHGRYDPDQPVWVIAFELESAEPPTRWLAADVGYTTDPRIALPDEPPAVDAETQEWLTYRAHRAFDLTHTQRQRDRERTTLEQRLGRARTLAAVAAKGNGYDASKHLRVIEQRIARLERDLSDRHAS
jgi:hypothetical protein